MGRGRPSRWKELKIGWPSGRAGSSPAPGIAQLSQMRDGAPGPAKAFGAMGQRKGQHDATNARRTRLTRER
jgi:hypothetical protein